MKKIIIILSVYTVLIFAAAQIVSGVYGHLPYLLGGYGSYKFSRGLLWFLKILPGILLSGLTVSCCVQWKNDASASSIRFSKAMLSRYTIVFFVCLALCFILSLNNEIFIPSLQKGMAKREKAPAELERAKQTARELVGDDEIYLALQYAKKALEISPKDEEAVIINRQISDYLEMQKNKEFYQRSSAALFNEKISRPLEEHDKGYSIYQLIQLSKEAASEKKWFNAHYWAKLAVDACDGTNTNRTAAIEAANHAWNMLNKPVEYNNKEERDLYAKKRAGYAALTSGDYLRSYYIFADLKFNSDEKTEDPDIERFFALAEEQVENQYFFFDETENMGIMESSKNIYFTLFYPDGSRDVFFMKGTMDMKKDGGLVRYISDLTVVNYLPKGEFNYSFFVPFAKVIAENTSIINAETKRDLGINRKWKSIPLIQLCSVDRETEGVVSRPEFYFSESDLPEALKEKFKMIPYIAEESEVLTENTEETKENDYIAEFVKKSEADKQAAYEEKLDAVRREIPKMNMKLLPLDYSDFVLLNANTNNAEEMNIITLGKFMKKAVNYGFAKEIYTESLVSRICYPMFILLLLMVAAGSGWSYRIQGEKTMFKFIWLGAVPVFTIFMIAFYEILKYLYNMLNYVLVGTLGTGAVFIAFIIYFVLFLFSSIMFCSHRG